MLENIKQFLNNYYNLFPDERGLFSILDQQIKLNEDLGSRKNFVGHVTASGLVLLENKIVLVIFHNKLQKYLQPGGHIELVDENLLAAARREVLEETGLKNISLHEWCETNVCPILIDTHFIPANEKNKEPEHYHHDFMFVFHTQSKELAIDKNEVSDFIWLDIQKIEDNSNVKKSLDKMKKLALI
jgi:8-oxo-dGTP pyrophosphatase MutT (NUDIX family)